MRNEKIDVIQAMRGIAALLVVLWHASRYFGPYGTGWAGPLFKPGAVMGVDLFFLISGFIMVVTTRTGAGAPRNTLEFLIKRFARVWPAYLISCLVFAGIVRGFSGYGSGSGLLHFLGGVFFIPTNAGVDAPIFDWPPNPVGWTLNYEMYFYVIFALAMLFGRWRWMVFFGWLAVTVGGSYLIGTGQIRLDPSAQNGLTGYFGLITNPILLLFAAGVLTGIVYSSTFTIKDSIHVRSLIFLAPALVVFQYASGLRTEHGVLGWGLSLIPFFFLFAVASKTIPMQAPVTLVYLGEISFSMYIFHPTIQEGYDMVASTFLDAHARSGLAPFFITTVLTLVVAAYTHRYLELGLSQSIRRGLNRMLLTNRGAAADAPQGLARAASQAPVIPTRV